MHGILTVVLCIFLGSSSIYTNIAQILQPPIQSGNVISDPASWNIPIHDVTSIQLSSTLLHWFEPFSVTNRQDIQAILTYMSSLCAAAGEPVPEDLFGSSYTIAVTFRNGQTKQFYHTGNTCFGEQGTLPRRIPYEQAAAFNTILSTALRHHLDAQGFTQKAGTIANYTQQTIRDCSFDLIVNGIPQSFSVTDLHIMDTTGHGWLILNDGDQVELYFDNHNQPVFIFILQNAPEKGNG